MTEDFLHFLWYNQLYRDDAYLSCGTKFHVINPGVPNRDAGPDFFNAKIEIGNKIWVGNVEIHIQASDWYRHNHHLDSSYDNVILHVVAHNDRLVKCKSGVEISSFEIHPDASVLNLYQSLTDNSLAQQCGNYFSKISSMERLSVFTSAFVERIEKKIKHRSEIRKPEPDFTQIGFLYLFRAFGMKVNAEPFEMLASKLNYRILLRYAWNIELLEALIFGQAGMLHKPWKDAYMKHIASEYFFLKEKHRLAPMQSHLWKFMRIRPAGFPTVRMAQLAALFNSNPSIIGSWLSCDSLSAVKKALSFHMSDYWKNHYNFGKELVRRNNQPGKYFQDSLIINAFVPVMFEYSALSGSYDYIERAIAILEELSPENNYIIRKWKELGVYPENAMQSQALIHIYNAFCSQGECIHCPLGRKFLFKQIDSYEDKRKSRKRQTQGKAHE
ncbi:MAG: hypothetical protein C0594_18010 [Marinilabiliales bacterium]|nr:MAG: hypothetical protein C0594_18010 [Marinilabiliales bacterium]